MATPTATPGFREQSLPCPGPASRVLDGEEGQAPPLRGPGQLHLEGLSHGQGCHPPSECWWWQQLLRDRSLGSDQWVGAGGGPGSRAHRWHSGQRWSCWVSSSQSTSHTEQTFMGHSAPCPELRPPTLSSLSPSFGTSVDGAHLILS